ncbi:MAG: DUF5666 domain-containing protein, partial [Rhodospirillales bacterium]
FWRTTLRKLMSAAIVFLCVVAAPSWTPLFPDDRGIGGTGIDGGGIGGTGAPKPAPTILTDRGIGGTGIVGTITGFGSIFVNGQEINYTEGLPVNSIDGVIAPKNFAVGQVVAVEAETRNGELFANNAEIITPVAGRISEVDSKGGRIKVYGQWIKLADDTRFHDTTNQAADLKPGNYIAVSGFKRPDGVIDATRIERRRDGPGSVTGPITSINNRGFTVGTVRIESPIGSRARKINVGDQLTANGIAGTNSLRATQLTPRSAKPFGGRMRKLVIEGYAKPGPAGIGLTLRGMNVDPSTLPAGRDISNRRVIVSGDAIPGEALQVERLNELPVRRSIPIERLRQQSIQPGQNLPKALQRPNTTPNQVRQTPQQIERQIERRQPTRPPGLRRPPPTQWDRPASPARRYVPRRPAPRHNRRR